MVLIPENPMEEEVLKQLAKQDNEITEVRTGVTLLNKTIPNGIVISKKPSPKEEVPADGPKTEAVQ